MQNDEQKQTAASLIEPVISCEFFRDIKNKVVSTTGDGVTNKSICLIIYLYEQHKKSR